MNDHVAEGLLKEKLALEGFINILNQEQAALIDGDSDQVLKLSEQKSIFVDQLNRFESQRQPQFNAFLLKEQMVTYNSWIADLDDSAKVIWDELLSLAKVAHRINQINGELIQTHLQNNQQALTLLMSLANRANLYGADGQSKPGNSTTTIIDKA